MVKDSGLIFFLWLYVSCVCTRYSGVMAEAQLLHSLCLHHGVLKFGYWEEVLLSGTCRRVPNLFNLEALPFSHEVVAWLVVKSQGLVLWLLKKKCIPITPWNALAVP